MRLRIGLVSSFVVALGVNSPTLAQPTVSHVDVFTSGNEGYHTFRIPAIVRAPDGSLLAFTEGRKENRSDPGGGDIDLVYKRSTDAGATWSRLLIADDPGAGWSASNPTPVVDPKAGRVFILYNRWEPGFGTVLSEPGTANNQTWIRHSADDGLSWSKPRDITRFARDFEGWGAMFLGPGGAIQTTTGRLIVPAAAKIGKDFSVLVSADQEPQTATYMRAYVLFSDDHGETWQRGEMIGALTDENQVVELADGTVMIDARQSRGGRRWVAISRDGGITWSRPRPGQEVGRVATAIERYPLKAQGADVNRIIWTGPKGPGRLNLVLRVSEDEGQTFVQERLLYGGFAAYSDLEMLDDGSVGVLWERGVSVGYQFITFTRFDLQSRASRD